MKNNNAGMTLVEIIVAVLLITITTVGSLQFLIYCNKFAFGADTKIMASNFARETMEGLYRESYDLLIPGSYPATVVTGQGFDTSSLCTQYGGTRTYSISPVLHDSVTNTDYKTITVTVTWNQ
ncbi:MAG: prepilin-type N-terminal cleavage/methylation domain-containing protein [Candidatus Omnitrophota bacterium]